MNVTNSVDSLQEIRERSAERFRQLGWPTTRLEEWKYTNLTPASRIPWKSASAVIPFTSHAASLAQQAAVELVFVNGKLAAAHGEAAGVTVRPLSESDVEQHLAGHADIEQHAMTALNTAEFRDGAFVGLASGVICPGFVHLLFLSEGDETWSHPRTLIVAGTNSQLTILESYVGSGHYLTNAVTELVAEAGSVVDYYRFVSESAEATHVGMLQIQQSRSSSVTAHNAAVGGALVRNDIAAVLAGEGAALTLNGLFIGAKKQHLDNHTVIDHQAPHCDSLELYKGILDDEARGVFDGTIIVREGAVKTSSRQTNRNLLLSGTAIADSKPTLVIHNDDVKCNHGSTIGQLDEESMFYMLSRGIGPEQARHLLIYAFASEVAEKVRIEALQQRIRKAMFEQLPGKVLDRRENER